MKLPVIGRELAVRPAVRAVSHHVSKPSATKALDPRKIAAGSVGPEVLQRPVLLVRGAAVSSDRNPGRPP